MRVKYRKIKKNDVGQLQNFYKTNGMKNAGNISNQFLLKCINSELKNYIMFFIAEHKNEIIGAVYFVDQGGLITIWSIAISDDYRNQGIGAELIKKGIKVMGKKRRKMISTIIDPSNASSLQIFKKLGFTRERARIRLDKIC